MKIRLADGSEVPFSTVSTAELGRGPSSIERARRQRSVSVRADVDRAVGANPNDINLELQQTVLPALVAKYDGMSFSMEGQQAQQAETMGGMMRGAVISLLLIFALLALAFKSWIQPIIVMTAIPFGAVGALVAHMLFGYSVTLLSMIGLMAMAGVVVNDSLVMIEFINKSRHAGVPPMRAVLEAGPRRFRAIILTSLTTFVGLFPMLLETSVQAKFLIPMAIALAFGVMFSTMITLVMIPCFYLIVEDARAAVRWVLGLKGEHDHAPGFVEDEDEAPAVGSPILDEINDMLVPVTASANGRPQRLSSTESRRLRLDNLRATKSGRLMPVDDPDPRDPS
jgi:multidrug efflux pump subunit AcrB